MKSFSIDNLKSAIKQGDPTGFTYLTYKPTMVQTGFPNMESFLKAFYNGRTVTLYMKNGYLHVNKLYDAYQVTT